MSDESHKDLIRKADEAMDEAKDAIRRGQGFLDEIRLVESLSEQEAKKHRERDEKRH